MLYRPSSSVFESLRSLFKRRVKDATFAVLGDSGGSGARVDVPGRSGYVYVRFPAGTDTNGNTVYSPPTMARSGSAAYVNTPGFGVYVHINDSNELEIKSAHSQSLTQAGIDTRALNPLNQQSKWVYPFQLTYGLAMQVANSVTASTLISVKRFRHYTGNLLQAFDTPLEADKVDLASHIPAVDEHCYAAVWIDTYLNEAVVTTSIAQPTDEPLDETDIQEAVANRPPDATPLKAFYLANDQSTITQSAFDVDLRLWLYNPPVWGFPTDLETLERVRPGYTLVTGDYTTSGVGSLTIESGGRVIIVHKSNVTSTAPTAGDDSADGYSVGSLWFDTATDTLYVATDVSVGAAIWETASGGGDVSFIGGDAIGTAVSAPDTITISVLDDGITTAKLADDAVTTAKIDDAAVTNGKIAAVTIQLDRMADQAPRTFVEIDENGAWIAERYPYVVVIGQLGENVAALDFMARNETDKKWYKANSTYASAVMGFARGVILGIGTLTTNSQVPILMQGPLDGFTGLTNQGKMYAHTSAGGYTQTLPTPTLDGNPVIIAPYGWATSTVSMMVDCLSPDVIYRQYATMSDDEVASLTHHTDAEGQRRIEARAVVYDSAVAESYASTNQDTNLQLRGQSGAGATLNADTTGGTAYAVGDSGGTEFRHAQSFTVVTAGVLDQITWNSRANGGTPTGNVTVSVRADNAGSPAASSLWTGSVVWAAAALNTLAVTNGPFCNAGDVIWVTWEPSVAQTNNFRYILDGSAASTYAGGVAKSSQTVALPFPDTWSAALAGDIRASIRTAAVTANDALAQGVSHSSTITVTKIRLWLRKVGNPTGTLSVDLCADSGGNPGATITNGDTDASTTVLAAYGWVEFEYGVGARPVLSASTQYHIKLTTGDSASNTNYIEWGTDSSSPSYANGQMKTLQTATWSATSPASDGCFELYAQSTEFEEDLAIAQWTGGIGQIGIRRGNPTTGADRTTITAFKNISGETLVCIFDVILP